MGDLNGERRACLGEGPTTPRNGVLNTHQGGIIYKPAFRFPRGDFNGLGLKRVSGSESTARVGPPGRVSRGFALTWYHALTWYSSPARPFAAPDVPLLVTGQQGSPSPACRQLSRAPNACAESSREESTKLGHGSKLGRTLC